LTATLPAAAGDLITFLKVLPDFRLRRGIRFSQWWMLLDGMLSILSGQGSLVGMERFAKRHSQTLNDLLGTDFGRLPSDSTFRLLLAQLDVPGFGVPTPNDSPELTDSEDPLDDDATADLFSEMTDEVKAEAAAELDAAIEAVEEEEAEALVAQAEAEAEAEGQSEADEDKGNKQG
jgi:hypothetical protein